VAGLAGRPRGRAALARRGLPRDRAQAKAEGATIYFGDEAGIRSDYHAGTTWAPIGQTPVVKATGARHSLNMISAVTAQGLLRFSTYTGSFTAAWFIEFCRKLLADTDRPVYLIVDGHPTHRSKAVAAFVASACAVAPAQPGAEWCRVTQHEDLDVLGRVGSSEQRQPGQHRPSIRYASRKATREIMLRWLPTLSARSVSDRESRAQRR
jgi:hypothetical protein